MRTHTLTFMQCKKESKMLEAFEKVNKADITVEQFVNVAKEYSEDKAKIGEAHLNITI